MTAEGAWRFDVACGVLTCGDRCVHLCRLECAMVAMLAAAHGRIVTMDGLIRALWLKNEPTDAANSIRVYSLRIRRKLVAAGLPRDALVNDRGRGYSWRPVTELVNRAPLLLPSRYVRDLRRLLASHHDRDRADMVRWAIFGV